MYMALSVAVGGAIGAVSRYWISSYVQHVTGGGFPWGTLAVNVLGCAILGVVVQLMAHAWSPSEHVRGLLISGLLGALTTFSAFSLEIVLMIERNDWMSAAIYVAFSVILCVGGALGTMYLTRLLVL